MEMQISMTWLDFNKNGGQKSPIRAVCCGKGSVPVWGLSWEVKDSVRNGGRVSQEVVGAGERWPIS